MERTLYVTLLGRFSMRWPSYDGPGIITDQDSTSWRLWTFLQYMCTFHNKQITQEEIIDVLWNDVEISNPVNTIKTLLHRSRLMLERLGFPDGKQVLLYRRGVYCWDPEMTIWTDIEEFERLCAKFDASPDSEEGFEAAKRAVSLYQGDFLPNVAGSPWALSPRTYYHTKYLRLCFDAASSLWKNGRTEEALSICRGATALDPYDEACQLLMMRLLYATGSKQLAAQYYSDVSNLLMVQLGVSPSEEMTKLYHELSNSADDPEMDMQAIRADLIDRERGEGAFYCEYGVFRDIYSLVVRSAARNGQVVQLAVITLTGQNGQPLPPARRQAAMETLRDAICACLRSGDVFTQLSSVQYLLILPTASYENGSLAIQRALNQYRSSMMGKITTARCGLLSAMSSEQNVPNFPGRKKPKMSDGVKYI